ncbi:IS1 family transposase [Escherichia coli]|nr:hypothetical protein [Escherichia coli]MBW9397594.1 hypothetical protein [Escherichia coli]
MASVSISCPSCSATDGVVRTLSLCQN